MRVGGIGSGYVVRDPEAEAVWGEGRVDRLLGQEGVA
jgi:hypothetical protein